MTTRVRIPDSRIDLSSRKALTPNTRRGRLYLPDPRDAISVKPGITGDERNLLFLSLCDQQAVEWIAMRPRQPGAAHDLPEADLELLETVQRHLVGKIPIHGRGEPQFVQ